MNASDSLRVPEGCSVFLKLSERSLGPLNFCQESFKVFRSVWKSLRDPHSLSVVYESLAYSLEGSQIETFRDPNCLPGFSGSAEVQKSALQY